MCEERLRKSVIVGDVTVRSEMQELSRNIVMKTDNANTHRYTDKETRVTRKERVYFLFCSLQLIVHFLFCVFRHFTIKSHPNNSISACF